jgi:general secretion pathway protein L
MSAAVAWRWWVRQLASLMPSGLRKASFAGGRRITVDIDGHRLGWTDGSGGERIDVPLQDRDGGTADALAQPQPLPVSPSRVQVRLAPADYLLTRLSLPPAARAHLREAVGYQLPRLVPFSTEQVLYACGIDNAATTDAQLEAWVVVVPQSRLATALQTLGITAIPDSLPVDTPPRAGEALAFDWRLPQNNGLTPGWVRAAWLGAIGVLLFAGGLHLYNRQATYDALETTLAGLRTEAVGVADLRRQVTETTSGLDWLTAKKAATVATLRVLDVLTRELDDDTWLQLLEVDEGRVSMQGISTAPAALIEILEDTALFANVRFEAAITQDRRNSGNRFSISADLVGEDDGGRR